MFFTVVKANMLDLMSIKSKGAPPMAHIEKYKAQSVGHMLAHYRRDRSSMERDNIDPSRTDRNYCVGVFEVDGEQKAGRAKWKDGSPNWETVKYRIDRVNEQAKVSGQRATRKDAVVLADVVVTLPENIRKGDEDKFFKQTYFFLNQKFGTENMLGGFVHRDEMRTRTVKDERTGEVSVVQTGERVRDHMHVPFTPILDGRFNYKKMCPRSFYQTLHKELADHLEHELGYRPEIELNENKRAERALSQVDKGDIDAAREAIVEPAQAQAGEVLAAAKAQAAQIVAEAERKAAEAVERAQDELDGIEDAKEQAQADLEAAEADRDKAIAACDEQMDRLECLRRTCEECEPLVVELESAAAKVSDLGNAGRSKFCERINALASQVWGAFRALDSGRDRVGKAMAGLSWKLKQWHPPEKSYMERLRDELGERQAAERAMNRARGIPQPRRAKGIDR